MAQIVINEISKNYTYSSGTSTFCSVALPITASWGPAFEDPASAGKSLDDMLETTAFQHFPATQEGLEAFTATYRGPAANYRSSKDYSYQIALTLLTAGYDLDVCRVCSGSHSSGKFNATIGSGESASSGSLTLRAKYPGSFGNNLVGSFTKVKGRNYWNLITYIVDSTGARNAVENIIFVFDIENSTDTVPHVSEVTPAFFDLVIDNIGQDDDVTFDTDTVVLEGGSDRLADSTAAEMMDDAIELATTRYGLVGASDPTDYLATLNNIKNSNPSVQKASTIRYMEWNYNATYYILELLTDKVAYSHKRMILPGWDDQNFYFLTDDLVARIGSISPLQARMLEVAAQTRCATALLDIPKSLLRSGVWNDSPAASSEGYVQKIGRYQPEGALGADALFPTHSAIVAPWCQYKYVGTARNNPAPPAFLALMIQISMIRNQSLQYEWAQPTTRKHNLVIGAPDYRVPKRLLDQWQGSSGIGVNVITPIPDMGVTLWGNSTAFEVPVATYQALANLSSRYLVNAIEDVVYKCGIAITFQYNNQEAYSKFFAGVSPLLDTMKAVGAITAYTISMSKDLNALDSVNLNSVVGVIQVWIEGVINDINIDLICLPAGTEGAS